MKHKSPPYSIAILLLVIVSSAFSQPLFASTGVIVNTYVAQYQSINEGKDLIYIADGPSNIALGPLSRPMQQGLFVRPLRNDNPVRISTIVGNQANVTSFAVSPDESIVVFSSGGELYSTDLNGEQSRNLNINLPSSNSILSRLSSFIITPDSKQVIYSVLLPSGGGLSPSFTTLYRVPITGGPSTPLSPNIPNFEFTGMGLISPNSKYMTLELTVFDGFQTLFELSSINLESGTTIKLNNRSATDTTTSPLFTPNSNFIVYSAPDGVFRIPVAGGDSIKISDDFVVGGSLSQKLLDSTGEFVYYTASQDTAGVNELYKVSINGGGSIKLATNLASGESISADSDIEISNDDTHIVFQLDNQSLYSVPTTPGPAMKLNEAGRVISFRVSEDSQSVIFNADSDIGGLFELFYSAIDASATTKLSKEFERFPTNPEANGEIFFDISPDSQRVAYRFDIDNNFRSEVFEVPLTGGRSVKIERNELNNVNSNIPRYTLDGSGVLFTIGLFRNNLNTLYFADLAPAERASGDEQLCFPITSPRGTAVICL